MRARPLIRIGAVPAAFAGSATFFDGAIACAHTARIEADSEDRNMLIKLGETVVATWPFADIRSVADQANDDQLILTCSATPGARLVLDDPDLRAGLRARAPRHRKRTSHVGRARLLGWAVGAVAAVAVIVMVLVPALADRLAAFLPPEGEVALGDATFEQVRSGLDRTGFLPIALCADPDGIAALDDLMARVKADTATAHDVRLSVLDHPMVNAFALPGGRIILFRGLIEASESPDEVAAVMAHELGHIAARDPTRIALRSVGTLGVVGLLLGDFAGGTVVLFLTERLIQAAYTREAEEAADSFAHERLIAAGISPAAIATFFDRMRAKTGETEGLIAHFLSHPALGDRIAAARRAAETGGPYAPALPPEEWTAVQEVCSASPPIASEDGL